MFERRNQQNIDRLSGSDRVIWLADQIFKAFPEDVSGLVFYISDCVCIYYQRKFLDGKLDQKVGIYRNAGYVKLLNL